MRKHALALLIMVIAGCTSPAIENRYYYIDPVLALADQEKGNIDVAITSVRMSAPINGMGITMRIDDRYQPAVHHRWSGDAEEMLLNYIVAALNQSSLLTARFADGAFPVDSSEYTVEIYVTQFNGNTNGDAEVNAAWAIYKVAEGEPVQVKRNQLKQNVPLKGDGYGALVQALSLGWKDVAGAIQQDLEALGKGTT